MNQKMFFGGVPTEPDIKKIKTEYPTNVLTPGKKIAYAEIERLIGVGKREHRFKTVTSQWRKEVEKEVNIIIGCDPGEGFRVLNEPEKVDLSSSKTRSAGRAARRAYVVAARTDIKELDENDRKRLDHIMGVSSRVLAAAKLKSKVELPQIT